MKIGRTSASRRRRGLILTAVALASMATVASASSKLTLVAYSTPQEAYASIISDFGKTPAGKGVTFDQSYGASGDQSRAVAAGLGADIVAFSLEPDITRLVQANLVSPDWNKDADHGFVTDSVVVFTVRKGNPKHLKTWADLIKPGVDVLIPNWQTSGGAKWDVLAAYGAQRRQGKSDQQAVDYLKALYKNVSVQDKSARDALNTFTAGKGDVLIGYENEAIAARQHHIAVDYVIPTPTIKIENPVAVVKTTGDLATARAFVSFLHTPKAQLDFAAKGYRPVNKTILAKKRWRKTYPRVKGLFDIGTLGGWDYANKTFFDPNNGVLAKIARG
ncbi:MAG: sulfate ABC transporter substrate-binding protein [Thermoleophilia bacterium]